MLPRQQVINLANPVRANHYLARGLCIWLKPGVWGHTANGIFNIAQLLQNSSPWGRGIPAVYPYNTDWGISSQVHPGGYQRSLYLGGTSSAYWASGTTVGKLSPNFTSSSLGWTMCAWYKLYSVDPTYTLRQICGWGADPPANDSLIEMLVSSTDVTSHWYGGGNSGSANYIEGAEFAVWRHAAIRGWSDGSTTWVQALANGRAGTAVDAGNVLSPTDTIFRISKPSYHGYMHGLVDDVMLYNRALTEEEIRSLVLEGRSGYPTLLNWIPNKASYAVYTTATGHPATRRLAMSSGGIYRPVEIGRQGAQVI